MVLTDCDCAVFGFAYRGGTRTENASDRGDAEARVRRHKARDRQRIIEGVEPIFWGVHLHGRHCTEGPS